jgi:pyruvate formate lyase activating enzyme
MMILHEPAGKNGELKCLLCPHGCIIAPGKKGICRVRENDGSGISLTTYGVISGYALDPVEKKPLYHFFPGKPILSVGSYGCNMRCDFCQNDQISQHGQQNDNYILSPSELVSKALQITDNVGIAYTYNEPAIWYEYVVDCAELLKEKGLHNVMITNGYVNEKPLHDYLELIDAFNVDLKAFDDGFYHHYTGASLKEVLNNLVSIAKAGRHLEVTTLIIPGLNDSKEAMVAEAKWIAENLGPDIPLHISRYFPKYKRTDPPTPFETIILLCEKASEHLSFVYTGNLVPDLGGSDTVCPTCGKTVIKRSGYKTTNTGLTEEGRCSVCDDVIIRADFLRLQ